MAPSGLKGQMPASSHVAYGTEMNAKCRAARSAATASSSAWFAHVLPVRNAMYPPPPRGWEMFERPVPLVTVLL